MSTEPPTGAQKRGFYVMAFCVAFGVDLVVSLTRGGGYRPSLIGVAIMITAALYFAWSWFRER